MKVHGIVFLIVIGALLFAPAVSAKIVETKDGYVVTTVDTASRLPSVIPMSSASISQGQTQRYSSYISGGKSAFTVDLNWGVPSNSLSLTLNAPDTALGPYYDAADGRTDGRVNLRISNSGGLTSGTWWSHVYGYQVTGSQAYTYTGTVS
ncbi:peptidase domain-containing protein [Methanoregula sp.]|jgi:hypothetical protein|uniref:peptidase domain-containing protein n=1 Tax=Methanoregula sp. TaxID=2052170 RepID=UPI003565F182